MTSLDIYGASQVC